MEDTQPHRLLIRGNDSWHAIVWETNWKSLHRKNIFFLYIGLQKKFDYDIIIIVRQIKRLYNYKIRQYFVYIIVHVFFEYLSIKYFFYISYPPFLNN